MGRNVILKSSFFNRDTLEVTKDLMGKYLCRRFDDGKILRLQLNEIEAYDGEKDKACHASKGKTMRNAVMYGPAGVWYVYLCYGVHWMLNIVVGDTDYPAAILIRGAGNVVGPGRLTKALSIDKQFDGIKSQRTNALWIEDDGTKVSDKEIIKAPRIGVDYAGKEWALKPYRFMTRTA